MRKLFLSVCFIASWANFVLGQCNSDFFDGFESGSYTPTWTMGTGLTSGAVTTTNPASGLYRLEGTGGTSTHLTGFSTTIPSATPTSISWDIFPTGTGASNYMVLGNSSVTASNCVAFCYWQGGTNIRFVSSSTAIYTCPAGAWYHIEMRNINWTAHTFDIYINNNLVQLNFPFRSATQNDLSRIHLYNFNSATGVWDNITVGTGSAPINASLVTPPLCNGGSDGAIDLSVTGGNPSYSYLWSTGDTSQDISALVAGTYTVTVTDQTPCSTATNIVVTEPMPIVIAPVATDLSCNGSGDGMVTTNASGGTGAFTYLWSNGATTQNIDSIAAGPYMVTVTDANGCTEVDSATAAEPSAIVFADSLSLPLCNGDSNGSLLVTPSGGAGSYTYLWSTGDVTPSTGLIPTGTYSVVVTDTTGCSQTHSILLPEPAPFSVSSVATNPGCIGSSNGAIDLTPQGGTPAYSYLWNTGDTIEDLTGLTATVFIVLVSDANGCSDADTIILNNPTPISVGGTALDDTGSNNGSIDLTVSGGTPGYTYLWSNGATTEDLSGLGAGVYNVTVTDNNGCTSTQTFTISLVIAVGTPNGMHFTAYPNPFQKGFTVALNAESLEPKMLTVTDMQGRILWMDPAVVDAMVQVDVDLPEGIYFLNLKQGNFTQTLKLLRQE